MKVLLARLGQCSGLAEVKRDADPFGLCIEEARRHGFPPTRAPSLPRPALFPFWNKSGTSRLNRASVRSKELADEIPCHVYVSCPSTYISAGHESGPRPPFQGGSTGSNPVGATDKSPGQRPYAVAAPKR